MGNHVRARRVALTATLGTMLLAGVLLLYRADVFGITRGVELPTREGLLAHLPLAQMPSGGAPETNGLVASGVIQADAVALASEAGGRIAAIEVSEGEAVSAGQIVVRLDTTHLDAQIDAARAGVAVAEAALAQAEAGARPGQIAVVRAQVAQAEAAQAMARQAVSDTAALIENPQELDLEIVGARGELAATQHQLEAAQALEEDYRFAKDHAEAMIDKYGPEGDDVTVPVGEGADGQPIYGDVHVSVPVAAHLAHVPWWKSWVTINATQAQLDGLGQELAHLYAQRENPQDAQARHDEALAALESATAQRAAAQAQLERLESGASAEALAALRARVAQARVSVDTLEQQRERLTLRAPQGGTVLDLLAYRGEVVAPGAPLLDLANLSQLRLTLYVPEGAIGRVSLGQEVRVTTDSYPQRAFLGRVTHIAEEAEFTPRNVTTQEERAMLVFAVTVRLDNTEGALKPGMPADAVIIEEGQGS